MSDGTGPMTTQSSTDLFASLLSRCKCGVSLEVNQHRVYCQTAAQAIAEGRDFGNIPEISEMVVSKMIETDTIVRLNFYPSTPVGSYEILHHDVGEALRAALRILDAERR